MRLFAFAIVLGFPVLDLYVTLRFAHWSGVPVWVYLALSTLAGLALLRNEREAFRTRTVAALHGDHSLLRGLLDSGRKVLAGILLLLPGLVSDVIALALLALPINTGARFATLDTGGARRDALDGEFRRLD
jgi:UPF0716 protein FxsA